jgi:hypothetical protein
VIPERERVRARGEQAVGQLRRDPRAVGDVLGIDDADPGTELLLEPGQALLDRAASGRAEDVGDEEDLYGTEAALALPPSARAGSPGGRLK